MASVHAELERRLVRSRGLISEGKIRLDTLPVEIADQLLQEWNRIGGLTLLQVEMLSRGRGSLLMLDSYLIRERISDNESVALYTAFDVKNKRIVALKSVPENTRNTTAIFRGMFCENASRIIAWRHPNIIRIYAFNAEVPYVASEFINGIDLRSLIRLEGIPRLEDTVQFVKQAAAGLHYAHQHGVIHRDVKPENLMLVDNRLIKVIDWESVKPLQVGSKSRSATQFESPRILGTLGYMSPEHFESAELDERSDVYSLGCTLFTLITGKILFFENQDSRGFSENAYAAWRDRQRSAEPPRILDFRTDVPRGLSTLTEKMLEFDRGSRLSNMAEVIDALTSLETEVATASEPTVSTNSKSGTDSLYQSVPSPRVTRDEASTSVELMGSISEIFMRTEEVIRDIRADSIGIRNCIKRVKELYDDAIGRLESKPNELV